MSIQNTPTVIEVLDVLQSKGKILVAVKLMTGAIRSGMIFRAQDTNVRWRALGLSFQPYESWEQGVRMVSLECLDQEGELSKGMRLTSMS